MSYMLAASEVGPVQFDLLLVLACAGVVSLLLSRLRVAVIPAYLLAGIAIGPSGAGLIATPERVEQISQMALIVLMFSIGMHLDSSALRRGAASIVTIGFVSTLTATGLGWLVLSATPMSGPTALAAAMGLAMSSTAVVLRLLTQRRKLQTTTGRASVGVLLVQDLVVIGFLAALPLLAPGAAESIGEAGAGVADAAASEGGSVMRNMLLAVGGVLALIVVGRLVLPRLLREASRVGGSEVMLVLTAAIALGSALLTAVLGLSAELGAFIAGFILASTPFRHQLTGQLAPVRDLFMAVFFTAIGLQVDLAEILPVWWIIPVGTAALVLLKGANIAVVSWLVGAESGLACRVGLALAQSGEFSLVVFAVASEQGLLSNQESSLLIGVVIASLIVTPTVMGLGPWAGSLAQKYIGSAPWLRGPKMTEAGTLESEAHSAVIVAGFGVIGRACIESLEARGVLCTIIELNPTTVRTQTALGRRAVFGDISNPEVLESAGIEHARVVVLTLPDSDATMRAIRAVREFDPTIHIAVRVGTQPRAAIAERLGSDMVVVEETVAAMVLADHVVNLCRADGHDDGRDNGQDGLHATDSGGTTVIGREPG